MVLWWQLLACFLLLQPGSGQITPFDLPASFVRASSHADLETLYRENLEPDFKPYSASTYHVRDLLRMTLRFRQGRPKHLTLLLIKDNTVHAVPLAKTQPPLTAKRVLFIVEGLNNATRPRPHGLGLGLSLPDTLLLLNTWDEPRCPAAAATTAAAATAACPVPVFSLIKRWEWGADAAQPHLDVLVPFFSHFYGEVIDHPWEDKAPKALMRAAAQNGMDLNCTRLWLLELSRSPEGQRLLDVGITNNLKKGLKVELADYVDIESHARWRYLLSTDGFTASCRFGKLLQTNSPVLKEQSTWIEYYYRSVKPGLHYYAFNRDNVLQVLQQLEATAPAQLQAVAAAAQEFGFRHLSQHAKALYFGRAVQMYNANFPDVARLVAGLDATQRGLRLEQVLATMEAFAARA